ncbi:fumarate reductase/succinate dehydrogenase flavoprotein domain protein [Coriobacterium glomerans PW2]|uniref:Fumarate reductase/succinate dehydrogenase flavoprotein domain protein n=1 Tax=Coriobacterium glomerans (strain ATCC 49209 / DSM 20642 / JCM 10262 / PW2) TaxID=700015 RepID=F2NBC0_CORGP|nr:FAD-binding protein [Coriobacterium glomerans]AEB06656.1 fumarate reductase/succinate dehydrogenase flavoprotein domain protein [Coriobacterium glomerans PW2]
MLDENLRVSVITGVGQKISAKVEICHRAVAVVGSGAAALNAADWLCDLGQRNCVLVTEGMDMGTSRNAGSDKQTYYKLSIGPGNPDSTADMARALFEGGGVDGRVALAEAANSVRCFMKLVNLGVDFPTDAYGQFIGYKTDHDPCQRGTSAGPLTSRYMTEALERSVRMKNIEIRDKLMAFHILTSSDGIRGVICLDLLSAAEGRLKLVIFVCSNLIWCTGSPASIYEVVAYPESQTGMSGAALQAGAEAANLQDWQYGLASVGFRWNISGTYQQALPRYVAIDSQGNEREFLSDYGLTPIEAVDMTFYKGYQWPFDVGKCDGSSRIDLAVYEETMVKGNRVFLDFRRNPLGIKNGFSELSGEAFEYLKRSGVLFGNPFNRLTKMNPLAVKLFWDHGIDLEHEMVEIAMCAQHCNGGIRVDDNWQSSIRGLYVAGEAAGTFGAYRPGGSALNSTQVGSMRAAQHIVITSEAHFGSFTVENSAILKEAESCLRKLALHITGSDTCRPIVSELQKTMSTFAAQVRDMDAIERFREKLSGIRVAVERGELLGVRCVEDLPHLVKARDAIISQAAVISAIDASAKTFGSRGSAFVKRSGGNIELNSMGAQTRVSSNLRIITKKSIQDDFATWTEPVSEIPNPDSWFETAWAEHREKRGSLASIGKGVSL